MLVQYIHHAMSNAVYDKLDDGSFCGKIPDCPGVIAFAESLNHCQEELQSVLEGWLIVKVRHGDNLPVIGKVNLNTRSRTSDKKVNSPKEQGGMYDQRIFDQSQRKSSCRAIVF